MYKTETLDFIHKLTGGELGPSFHCVIDQQPEVHFACPLQLWSYAQYLLLTDVDGRVADAVEHTLDSGGWAEARSGHGYGLTTQDVTVGGRESQGDCTCMDESKYA